MFNSYKIDEKLFLFVEFKYKISLLINNIVLMMILFYWSTIGTHFNLKVLLLLFLLLLLLLLLLNTFDFDSVCMSGFIVITILIFNFIVINLILFVYPY